LKFIKTHKRKDLDIFDVIIRICDIGCKFKRKTESFLNNFFEEVGKDKSETIETVEYLLNLLKKEYENNGWEGYSYYYYYYYLFIYLFIYIFIFLIFTYK
jgi:hypothetical protein